MRCLTVGAVNLVLGTLLLQPGKAAALDTPVAERNAADEIVLHWQGADPVDVYLAARPDAALGAARLVSKADHGTYTLDKSPPGRPYFTLKDERNGDVVRVAERLLPLERGSNFRDLGGYPAANGKHLRWGLIYRSAATPLLTEADYHYLGQLGIVSLIDLRSVEERQIAPDLLPARTGARYFANDYPASDIFGNLNPRQPGAAGQSGSVTGLYRSWPTSLAPQFREIFRALLRHEGAVNYHCSAGQDRTGVATALVMSALGVPREVILADYHLSTQDRRPENEMPPIDPDRYPGNPVAAFYAKAQSAGGAMKAKPLYDESGIAYLQQTFEEIDTRWGSVDNYLHQVLGVDGKAIAQLRALYLE